MVRGLAAIGLFGCLIVGIAMFGGHLLNRRWDRKGFYE
jgi:hypothetical protein